MESEMLGAIMIFFYCIFMIGLVGVIGIVVFIEKRLSYSSSFRRILAVATGTGASIIGFFIIELFIERFVGGVVFKYDYMPIYSWVTDELIIATVGEKPNVPLILFLIYVLATVLKIMMSILGGYIGGKIARQDENMYGFLVGLSIILVYASLLHFNNTFFFSPPFHRLYLAVLYPAQFFAAALLGGYFALCQRKRDQSRFPFENATKFIKQGYLLEAQKLLKPLIAADHNNLPAWFLFVETCPTYQQKINALELCLELNPESEKVKHTLDKLHQSRVKDNA